VINIVQNIISCQLKPDVFDKAIQACRILKGITVYALEFQYRRPIYKFSGGDLPRISNNYY